MPRHSPRVSIVDKEYEIAIPVSVVHKKHQIQNRNLVSLYERNNGGPFVVPRHSPRVSIVDKEYEIAIPVSVVTSSSKYRVFLFSCAKNV